MFDKLSSILNDKLNKKNYLGRQVTIVQVFDMYKDGVRSLVPGGELVKPISLKNKTLIVEVGSPSLASELRMKEYELVETINQRFEQEVVNRVMYRF